jgi:diguanylate cyclase (GGDEF)-like protein/PAS domain S-box-containing protein
MDEAAAMRSHESPLADLMGVRWWQSVIDDSPDAILITDASGTVLYWNTGAARLYGWAAAEVIGQPVSAIIPPERTDEWRRFLEAAFQGRASEAFDTVRMAKGGRLIDVSLSITPLRDREGRIVAATAVARDISHLKQQERHRAKGFEELEWAATHDALTGLADRRIALLRATEQLRELGRNGGALAVMFVDVDDLKGTNDRVGHATGDAVLRVVAERLVRSARSHDVVARVGGDEFMVVAGPLRDRAVAVHLGTRLLDAVNHGLDNRTDVQVDVSLGIATTEDPSISLEDLIASADRAMYEAKAAGGGRLCLASDVAPSLGARRPAATGGRRRRGRRAGEQGVVVDLREDS